MVCAVSFYFKVKEITEKDRMTKMCNDEVMKDLLFQMQALFAADSPDIAKDLMWEREVYMSKLPKSDGHYLFEGHYHLSKSNKRLVFRIAWEMDTNNKPHIFSASADTDVVTYAKDSSIEKDLFKTCTLINVKFEWGSHIEKIRDLLDASTAPYQAENEEEKIE